VCKANYQISVGRLYKALIPHNKGDYEEWGAELTNNINKRVHKER
jgi:hypothetical protein